MGLINPMLAFVGLGAVALPVLIHLLLRRRHAPVPWGAMRFLAEAYRRQRRRMKLERLLLLLARCLVVACAALGLGRLLLGGDGSLAGSGTRTLYLVVDNSLTADIRIDDGTSLDRHRASAVALLDQLDPARGDRAALITLAGPAERVVFPPTTDLAAVRDALRAVTVDASAADLPGTWRAIQEEVEQADERVTVALLSESRAGFTPEGGAAPDPLDAEGLRVLLPRPGEDLGVTNVAIDDASPLRTTSLIDPRHQDAGASDAALEEAVRVALSRSGPTPPDTTTLTVSSIGQGTASSPVGSATVRWSNGQDRAEVLVPVRIPLGDSDDGEIRLRVDAEDDVLAADNTRHLGVSVRLGLRVGVVAPVGSGVARSAAEFRPADWVSIALEPGGDGAPLTGIEPVRLDPQSLSRSRLATLDAVFVLRPDLLGQRTWDDLAAFNSNGGLVVVTPPTDASSNAWAETVAGALGVTLEADAAPFEFDPPVTFRVGMPDPVDVGPFDAIVREFETLLAGVGVSRAVGLRTDEPAPLRLDDGSAVLVWASPARDADAASSQAGPVGVFMVALDLGWTDLPARAVFLPLVQEMLRQGVRDANAPLPAIAGRAAPLPRGAERLVSPSGAVSRAASPGVGPSIRRPGPYTAVDADGRSRGSVIVGPDTRASDITARAIEQADRWASTLVDPQSASYAWIDDRGVPDRDSSGPSSASGTEVSFWLLAAAAVFALFELVLGRVAARGSNPVPASVHDAGRAAA